MVDRNMEAHRNGGLILTPRKVNSTYLNIEVDWFLRSIDMTVVNLQMSTNLHVLGLISCQLQGLLLEMFINCVVLDNFLLALLWFYHLSLHRMLLPDLVSDMYFENLLRSQKKCAMTSVLIRHLMCRHLSSAVTSFSCAFSTNMFTVITLISFPLWYIDLPNLKTIRD